MEDRQCVGWWQTWCGFGSTYDMVHYVTLMVKKGWTVFDLWAPFRTLYFELYTQYLLSFGSKQSDATNHGGKKRFRLSRKVNKRWSEGGVKVLCLTLAQDDNAQTPIKFDWMMQPDYGGTVSGLFGNLRIPASLIAGAALGSAFGLPLNVMIGTVRRTDPSKIT